MAVFRYIGKAATEIETLGVVFEFKQDTDVSEGVAAKLRGNPSFIEVGAQVDMAEGEAPRRRGRPPRAQTAAPDEVSDGDEDPTP
jgi:hypothetical protein